MSYSNNNNNSECEKDKKAEFNNELNVDRVRISLISLDKIQFFAKRGYLNGYTSTY